MPRRPAPRRRVARRKPASKRAAAPRAAARTRRPARRSALTNVRRPIQSMSGHTSISSFKGVNRRYVKRANVSALGAKNVYVVNQGYEVESVPGGQAALTMGTWFSVADIYNMSLNVPQPVTQLIGSPPLAYQQPTMFHLHSLQAQLDFCNSTSASCVVDIYDIVAKRDIPVYNGTALNVNVSTPLVAWQNGIKNEGVVKAGDPDGEFQLGSLPTDSQLFNDYYQIKSRKTVLLAQNGLHTHHVTMTPNITSDGNLIGAQSTYLAGLRGITHYTMVVVHGQVAFANLLPENPNTVCGILLRSVVLERYTYSYLQATGKIWTSKNTLSQPEAADCQIINLNNPTEGVVIVNA